MTSKANHHPARSFLGALSQSRKKLATSPSTSAADQDQSSRQTQFVGYLLSNVMVPEFMVTETLARISEAQANTDPSMSNYILGNLLESRTQKAATVGLIFSTFSMMVSDDNDHETFIEECADYFREHGATMENNITANAFILCVEDAIDREDASGERCRLIGQRARRWHKRMLDLHLLTAQ